MEKLIKELQKWLNTEPGYHGAAFIHAKICHIEYSLYILTKDAKYKDSYDRGNERIK